MSALTVGTSGWTLARDDQPGFARALADGAVRYPGRGAAVWLLIQHGAWLTHPLFLDCCRMQPGGTLRVQWGKFARLAAGSEAFAYDVAVALSASDLAGYALTYDVPVAAPEQPASRRGVLERDEHRCVYCGDEATTIDHVLPASRGGRSTWGNLVAACGPCNEYKADRTPEELGWAFRSNRSHWPAERILRALGHIGEELVGEAMDRRTELQGRLDTAVDDGLSAVLACLAVPAMPEDRDARHRAMLQELSARLAVEAKSLERGAR